LTDKIIIFKLLKRETKKQMSNFKKGITPTIAITT